MPMPPQIKKMIASVPLESIRAPTRWDQFSILLPPAERPQEGESRFLIFDPDRDARVLGDATWPNGPPIGSVGRRVGGGLGFGIFSEKPQIFEDVSPSDVTDIFLFASDSFWVVSPKVLRLFSEFGVDLESYETLGLDYEVRGGVRLEGYVFLDVMRLIDSYDYRNCEINVRRCRGLFGRPEYLSASLTKARTFRDDITPNVHLFRDYYDRRDIVLSRSLAKFLRAAGVTGLVCNDPATGFDAFFEEDMEALGALEEEQDRRKS